MNYIGLVRAFWRSQEEHSFGPTEVALYFYLLEVCNICRWKNPFKRSNAKIEADLSMTFHVLKNARNRLKSAGLIDFKTTNGSPNVAYTLLPTLQINYEVDAEVRNEVSNEVVYEVPNEVVPSKDKLNKTKLITPLLSPRGDASASVPDLSANAEADDSLPDCAAAPQAPPDCAAPPRGDKKRAYVDLVTLRTELGLKGESFALTVVNAMRGLVDLKQSDVWGWLDRFTEEMLARGDTAKTMRDYRSHFVNWLKIQLEKQHAGHGNHQNSVCDAVPDGLTANERRYGSTRVAKQSIESRLKQLSAKVKADIP